MAMNQDMKSIHRRQTTTWRTLLAAELVLRAAGLGLIGSCSLLARLIVRDIHQTVVETATEFLLSGLAVFCLTRRPGVAAFRSSPVPADADPASCAPALTKLK
jgi:hypothetical protein